MHAASYQLFEKVLDKKHGTQKSLYINVEDGGVIIDRPNRHDLLLGGKNNNIYKLLPSDRVLTRRLRVNRIFDTGGQDVVELPVDEGDVYVARFGNDLILSYDSDTHALCISGFYLNDKYKIETLRLNNGTEYDLKKLAEFVNIGPVVQHTIENKSPQIKFEMMRYYSVKEMVNLNAKFIELQQKYKGDKQKFLSEFPDQMLKLSSTADIFAVYSLFDLLPSIYQDFQKRFQQQHLDLQSVYNNFPLKEQPDTSDLIDVKINSQQNFYEKCTQVISDAESAASIQKLGSLFGCLFNLVPTIFQSIDRQFTNLLHSMSAMNPSAENTDSFALSASNLNNQINLASPVT